jgi:hypothetical protein
LHFINDLFIIFEKLGVVMLNIVLGVAAVIPSVTAYRGIVSQGTAAVLTPFPTALCTFVAAAAFAKIAEHLGTRFLGLDMPERRSYKVYVVTGLGALSSFITVKSQFPVRFLTAISPVIGPKGLLTLGGLLALFLYSRATRRSFSPPPTWQNRNLKLDEDLPSNPSSSPAAPTLLASIFATKPKLDVEAILGRVNQAFGQMDKLNAGSAEQNPLKVVEVKEQSATIMSHIPYFFLKTNQTREMVDQSFKLEGPCPVSPQQQLEIFPKDVTDELADIFRNDKLTCYYDGMPKRFLSQDTSVIVRRVFDGLLEVVNSRYSNDKMAKVVAEERALQLIKLCSTHAAMPILQFLQSAIRTQIELEPSVVLGKLERNPKTVIRPGRDQGNYAIQQSYTQQLIHEGKAFAETEFRIRYFLDRTSGKIETHIDVEHFVEFGSEG